MIKPEERRRPVLLGSMRVRILTAVFVLLAGSSIVSIIVARTSLIRRLDEEVKVDLRQEAAEFHLLASGLNPQTGTPFGNDLEAVFELYFRRRSPTRASPCSPS